jgi:hypothetical protein
MQPPPSAQRSDLILHLLDTRTSAKRLSEPLKRFVLRPGFNPELHSLGRYYDYFFRDVFFATFLAAFAVFFAFFAFLAMSSSVKNWLSDRAHAVHRHTQHCDNTTKGN